MENIERLKKIIEGHESAIEKLKKMRLGFLLNRAARGSLNGQINRDNAYVDGPFHFTYHSHDTGVGVVVKIVNGEESMEVIRRTYWYNEAQYGFNSYVYLHGAWDKALNEAIEKIRSREIEYLKLEQQGDKEKLAELLDSEKQRKQRFEEIFN